MVDCVERAEHGLHARFDGLEAEVKRLLEYHEKAPPSTAPDDLQLMARILKEVKVGRMNAILKDLRMHRPTGLKKEDKAALMLNKMPRDRLLRILAGLAQEPASDQGPPAIFEPPARPAKRQRALKEFFCDGSASTETPDTASVSSEDLFELCGEITNNGHACDNIKGRCPYHAEGANRCESMVDGNREQRCKLHAKSGERYCCHHEEFPNLSVKAGEYLEKLTDEAPNEEAFLAKYFPVRKKLPPGFAELMRCAQ